MVEGSNVPPLPPQPREKSQTAAYWRVAAALARRCGLSHSFRERVTVTTFADYTGSSCSITAATASPTAFMHGVTFLVARHRRSPLASPGSLARGLSQCACRLALTMWSAGRFRVAVVCLRPSPRTNTELRRREGKPVFGPVPIMRQPLP